MQLQCQQYNIEFASCYNLLPFRKGKTADERGHEDKNSKRKKGFFSGDSDNSSDSDFVESDTNTKKQCQEGENNHRRNNGIEVMTNDKAGNGNNSILPFKKLNGLTVYPPKGQRFSERLWGTGKENISETMSFTTKKRLRQRLTINTAAAESADGVPDSEDEEDLSKDNDKQTRNCRNTYPASAFFVDNFVGVGES